MKLHTSPLSPYSRKAKILAKIKGIDLELIEAVKDGSNGYTGGMNALGKIPTLQITDDVVLYDSPVICEYLDSLNAPILPREGNERWHQLHLHALGDGISDAVYNYRYETVRDGNLHWDEMILRHETAIGSAITQLETSVDTLGRPWTFGNLSIVCALDYADFRAGHLGWRNFAPKLAEWHEKFAFQAVWKTTFAY